MLNGIRMGDVEKGFDEADIISEGTCGYEIFPNPLPPEPPGVIATWETPDCLTIYTPSQSIGFNRFIGMPFIGMADVRAISTQCGGSYGTKNANMTLVGYAALLSRATGRPVKTYYTKQEHFHSYSLRLGSRVHARVGMKRDGTLTAISGEWFVKHRIGLRIRPGPDCSGLWRAADSTPMCQLGPEDQIGLYKPFAIRHCPGIRGPGAGKFHSSGCIPGHGEGRYRPC